MAVQNLLIMNLLRIITPEEIADIATKHNGGKFLSLTDLVNERVEHKIYRDFSSTESLDEIHEAHSKQNKEEEVSAKILPFTKKESADVESEEAPIGPEQTPAPRFVVQAKTTSQVAYEPEPEVVQAKTIAPEHKEDENMSSFILIEKARLKQSQKSLKQKEIIDLYQKNSNVDVEQIKSTNQNPMSSSEVGVLVNKKQY
nr:hypothetical protein BHI3_37020 [Bacteriovorax sp. HI3]